MEVAGVRVYSCYLSLNDPFEIFETQILLESPSEYGKGRQGEEPFLEHKTTQQRQASGIS